MAEALSKTRKTRDAAFGSPDRWPSQKISLTVLEKRPRSTVRLEKRDVLTKKRARVSVNRTRK